MKKKKKEERGKEKEWKERKKERKKEKKTLWKGELSVGRSRAETGFIS